MLMEQETTVPLRRMITPPGATEEMGRFAAWWDGVKHALSELLSMGWDMQLPLWLGCVIVGLALAIPAYCVSYKFVESFRRAVAKKKQLRQGRRRRDAAMDVPLDGVYTRSKWPDGE